MENKDQYSIGKNYLHIKRDWQLFIQDVYPLPAYYYVYVDTADFLADHIFENANLKVKFVSTYQGIDNSFYKVVLVRFKMADLEKFIDCMNTLYRNQLLADVDYDELCKFFHKSSGSYEDSPYNNDEENL